MKKGPFKMKSSPAKLFDFSLHIGSKNKTKIKAKHGSRVNMDGGRGGGYMNMGT